MDIRTFHIMNADSDRVGVLISSADGQPLLWTEAVGDEIYIGDDNCTPDEDVSGDCAAEHVVRWIDSVGGLSDGDEIARDVNEIDDSSISSLRDKVESAGDYATMLLCERALDGDMLARIRCDAMISS